MDEPTGTARGQLTASAASSLHPALHRAVGRHPFSLQLPSPRCFLPPNGVKTVPSLCEREVTCVLTDGSWPRGPGAGLAAQTNLHGPSLDVQQESCFSEDVRRDGSLCLTEEAGRRHRCSWHPRRRSGRRRVGVSAAPLCSGGRGRRPSGLRAPGCPPYRNAPRRAAGLPPGPGAAGACSHAMLARFGFLCRMPLGVPRWPRSLRRHPGLGLRRARLPWMANGSPGSHNVPKPASRN